MVKQFAKLLSVVFHPLLMTTYLFLLLTYFLPIILQPLQPSWWFLFLICFMTFVLPALNFLFLRLTGSIKDLTLASRSQRILPFVFVSILYGVVTLMFYWKFPVPNVLKLMIIVTVLVTVATVITFFFKISVHSLALWGAIGMMLPMNKVAEEASLLIPTVAAIVVAGLVMSSRLFLNAHTPREVMVGAVAGFGIGFVGMVLLF